MAEVFYCKDYVYNEATGVLSLFYGFDRGGSFEERLSFKGERRETNKQEKEALDRLFRLLLLAAGVSYYKAYAPPVVQSLAFPLDVDTAAFAEKLYEKGLGEFAYKNKLNLKGRIRFLAATQKGKAPVRLSLPRRSLVPMGGGKDSAVTVESLKRAGEQPLLFALGGTQGPAQPIAESIGAAGLPFVFVERVLSPSLLELNRQGAMNGHVPITAILSLVALISAIIFGCDQVVMSNESSANAPNLDDVNHQYSKSLEFERDLQAYVAAHVSEDLGYFSLLRPLGETEIARRFAGLENYHPVFRSCNAAFKQKEQDRASHWCGDCPKCRFVFLALAPFMPKEKLVAIFAKNMLEDPAQKQGYEELCGLAAFKPFECVGEVEESAALVARLATMEAWKNDALIRDLAPRIGGINSLAKDRLDALLARRAESAMPEAYRKMIDEA
jgi:hypothetical protein